MLVHKKMAGKRFIPIPSPPPSSLEENAERLTRFGLTQNQAKIYLAISRLGTTQIEPISRLSSVRREDIYRILPKLYELGIVERIVGIPTRVKAVPIERAIRILVWNRQEALSRESAELAYQVEDFLESFTPPQDAPPEAGEGEQFSIIEGKPAVEGKIAGMLERTRHEVLIAFSGPHTIPFMTGLPVVLETLRETGMKIRVMTGQSHVLTLSAMIGGLKTGDLDFRLIHPDGNGGNYLISDGREAILITSDEQATRTSSLWTNNANFISLLRHDFETSWSGAPDARNRAAMSSGDGANNRIAPLSSPR
jgi:DNA-binding MarR family transcriptional regulator